MVYVVVPSFFNPENLHNLHRPKCKQNACRLSTFFPNKTQFQV